MPDLTGSLIPVSVFGARMTSEGETSSWRWDLLLKDFCIFSLFFFYHHILMSQPSKPETEWGKGCASVRDNEAILSCPRFYHLALTTTFWTKMLPFRCFAAHVIQSGSECVTVKTPPPPPPHPHFIWFVRFLLWFQTFSFFFFHHRMMKIWAIMTKTRKEGIRCVNRKISLLSSHFLLFMFLPAAAFTCRSQTRSLGQSPAK